jgi:hypothetical protein
MGDLALRGGRNPSAYVRHILADWLAAALLAAYMRPAPSGSGGAAAEETLPKPMDERQAVKLIDWADAHIATVGAASLDASLEGALLTKFRPLSKAMKDRLFDGGGYAPLANFAAKIEIAYALEIIAKDTYDALRLINKIRVVFAHSKKFTYFNDAKMTSHLENLLKLDAGVRSVPAIRRRFLEKLQEVEDLLRAVTAPEHQVPDGLAIRSREGTMLPVPPQSTNSPPEIHWARLQCSETTLRLRRYPRGSFVHVRASKTP